MSEFGVMMTIAYCAHAQEKVFEEDEFDLEFTRLVGLTIASSVHTCAAVPIISV